MDKYAATTRCGQLPDELDEASCPGRTVPGMGTKIRNDRLAEAMAQLQLTSTDLAVQLRVDPRTVDRWVEDQARFPRAESRLALSKIVQVPPGVLWPGAATGPQVTGELLAVYPCRTAMPAAHVMSLLNGAERSIDLLALAGMWLWDTVPDFGATLARKAAAGVPVRCCLGDPNGDSARLRGEEEGLGEGLRYRCEISLTYARRWLTASPESLRVHDTTLYASILRFDDDVLLNWHLYGSPAADSPVLHLRRADVRGLAQASIRSFDRVWEKSYPLAG